MDFRVQIPRFFPRPETKIPNPLKALAANHPNRKPHFVLGRKSAVILPLMDLTEIIFRVFAWARPLLWYYHRLRYLLSVAIRCLEDDACCLWLLDNASARAGFESTLVDAERCLEAAIALRVRELLNLPQPQGRLGLAGRHRIHSPASLERLAGRLDRLVDRFNEIERLAQLRARRLQRESEATPVCFEADHRPQDDLLVVVWPVFFFPCASVQSATLPAGLRIRAPPWPASGPAIKA